MTIDRFSDTAPIRTAPLGLPLVAYIQKVLCIGIKHF